MPATFNPKSYTQDTSMGTVPRTTAGAGALAPAPGKILSRQQAADYYAAMCLVHKTGALLCLYSEVERLVVREMESGRVNIFTFSVEREVDREENYPTFIDFAAAYGVKV